MKNILVIPDSSFFICFCDDISEPEYLIQILADARFNFVLGSIIKTELEKSSNNVVLEGYFKKHNVNCFDYNTYGELLRPFFSVNEINKGEHEVIVMTYILTFQGKHVIAILDDNSPKTFLKQKLPEISSNVIGTIGFVEKCTCDMEVFLKDEGINILKSIKHSKFWVTGTIIDDSINRIKECENGNQHQH